MHLHFSLLDHNYSMYSHELILFRFLRTPNWVINSSKQLNVSINLIERKQQNNTRIHVSTAQWGRRYEWISSNTSNRWWTEFSAENDLKKPKWKTLKRESKLLTIRQVWVRATHEELRNICVVMTFGTRKTQSKFKRGNERDIFVRHMHKHRHTQNIYDSRCVCVCVWPSVSCQCTTNARSVMHDINCKLTIRNFVHCNKWNGATDWPCAVCGVIDLSAPNCANVFISVFLFWPEKTHNFLEDFPSHSVWLLNELHANESHLFICLFFVFLRFGYLRPNQICDANIANDRSSLCGFQRMIFFLNGSQPSKLARMWEWPWNWCK